MMEYDALTVEGITVPLEDIKEHIQNKDSICIGSGLSLNEQNHLLLKEFLNYPNVM